MAKALQVFTGNDSYGRYSEYAEREDGVWFCREQGYNGYGVGLGRWFRSPTQDLSKLIKGDVMDYGFKPLHRGTADRLRLPNPKVAA